MVQDRSPFVTVENPTKKKVSAGLTRALAIRPRLALTLLLAAASVVAPSQLLAQLRPLGDEDVVATAEEVNACPAVAAREDGSAVVLRVHDDELHSVVIDADGSLGADHLLADGVSQRVGAIDGVTATSGGFLAAWRLPDVDRFPQPSLPGMHAGVGLDTAGAATSTPRALDHARDLLSPRPTGGYAALIPSADGHGIDLQLLSPLGAATSARVAVVRTGRHVLAVPQATLHRHDGQLTVLWSEVRTVGLETLQGTWMRSVSANGQPLGRAVRLLPALAPGLQRQVSAAIAADGTLALAWVEQPGLRPMLHTYTAAGIPLGRAVAIARGPATVHAMAFGAGGDVLVLWKAAGGPPPEAPIKASLFSHRGEPRGAAELASDASAGHPWMLCASVAATGSGTNGESWLVSWLASALPLGDLQIFARRIKHEG